VSSFRILTYNTQMRSALMEMGFPPSIPPVYTAPDRAKLISRAIVQSPVEIDVVCLNEIFDEPARDVLTSELEAEFPFQVAKADTFHTRIVSPGISDDIAEKVWELTFGPLDDLASIASLKFEDSGLFLASRFPFATVPTPPEVVALLGPLAFPQGVPRVRFFMYADSSDNDKFAAKGVLYAALKTPTGVRHVFMSHTQADTERAEENTGDRRKQIDVAAAFIEACVGQSPPFTEEVFFLGDLNVVGRPVDDRFAGEWTNLFGKPGAPMFEQLVDRWGRDQCPGGATGRADPGFTADVVYEPVRQRLDYLFTSATSQLAVQHLRVAKELADPQGKLPYLSDHQPLLADVNRTTQFCTPATALVTPPAAGDFDHSDALIEGMVRWYRFDVPGTYDVDLRHQGAETRYEIYLGDDFSTPQPPYREPSDPELGTRFVLAAPFFVKVFLVDRHSECSYTLRTHRHQGRTWRDAIVLVPGQARNEHFPKQPFNIDTGDADWDDSESKWFLVETPRVAVPRPIDLSVTVRNQTEDAGGGAEPTDVLLTLGRWDGVAPPASAVDQKGPDRDPITLEWQARDNDHFFVLVQRLTGTSTVVSFDIEARTSLTLLIARPSVDMSLTCQEETSGWGADDIALELRADGDLIAEIPNDVIGDFEDDAVRHVGDKVPNEFTPYTQGVEVKVIEEDDIDPDDVGTGTVPLVEAVVGAAGFTPLHVGTDGTLLGSLVIGVDDGRYAFVCRIARWHAGA
jgi:endonuclease/exonuclease/phosphatase family metal-dependent hydrolase